MAVIEMPTAVDTDHPEVVSLTTEITALIPQAEALRDEVMRLVRAHNEAFNRVCDHHEAIFTPTGYGPDDDASFEALANATGLTRLSEILDGADGILGKLGGEVL